MRLGGYGRSCFWYAEKNVDLDWRKHAEAGGSSLDSLLLPARTQRHPTVWRRPPAFRLVNKMGDISRFLEEWDRATETRFNGCYEFAESPFGNINSGGVPAGMSAPDVPYWHQDFNAAIEAGVRELVWALIQDGVWVSYSSCAGHLYPRGTFQNVERHVGLLPRDADELERMTELLESAVIHARGMLPRSAVEVALIATTLTGSAGSYPAVDVYMSRASGAPWNAYFDDLANATANFIELLSPFLQLNARRESGCSLEPAGKQE